MWHDSVCNTVQEPTVTSTIVAKKTTTWGESGFPSEFLAGGIPFMIRAKQLEIKPILGCELELEEGGHLILLVKDWSGYQSGRFT